MRIAVDFDNTLFLTNAKIWPEVLEVLPSLGAIKERQKAGDTIILFTCRTGAELKQAIEKCDEYGLVFDEQSDIKPQADVYIDDRSIQPPEFVISVNAGIFDECVEKYNKEIQDGSNTTE